MRDDTETAVLAGGCFWIMHWGPLDASGHWPGQVVTEISKAGPGCTAPFLGR